VLVEGDQVAGDGFQAGAVAGGADEDVGGQRVPSVKQAWGPSNRSMAGFMVIRPVLSAWAKPSSTAMVTPSVAWRVKAPSDGAFADGGGDAFDRAVADVAGGEYLPITG
jgi:hypothetical protein